MVDGYPLAQQGRATEALTAAITTSTLNGLFWGTLTFAPITLSMQNLLCILAYQNYGHLSY